MFFGTKRYVTLAYPSDERFRRDRSALIISRVPWLGLHNDSPVTSSYALAEVRGIRYGAITSLRGYSIYGLRFMADGKTRRILPGLKACDAEKILVALRSFGADVLDDSVLQRRLTEEAPKA